MAEEKKKTETALTTRPPVAIGFVPDTMEDAWRMAQHFAKSRMVPKDFQNNPEDVLVAVMWGAELGMKPMASLQGIAVINGRPAVYGDLLLAIVTSHPDYEDHKEWSDGEGDKLTYHCTFKRKGKEACTRSFSVADAKKAGLWGKAGPWTNYPQRMLQMRSRSWAARDRFPDALKGMHVAEEAMDVIPPETPGEPEIQMPRRVVQSPVASQVEKVVARCSACGEEIVGGVDDHQCQSKTRTSDEVEKQVEEKLGHPATIEDHATGRVSAAIKEAVEQPQGMKATMQEAQTGRPEPTAAQKSEAWQGEADSVMGEEQDDDFDVVVPSQEQPEKKLKKDMTSAEQHLGPEWGEDKSKWPTPKKVLTGDYERIKAMHTQQLHIVMNASKKRTEKDLYEKLWKEWGIESSKDIPRDKWQAVLDWVTGTQKKKGD